MEEHAELVRDIFRRYLTLGSVVQLKAALDHDYIRLPFRIDGTGKATGGGLFSRGHLYKILSNPNYIGRVAHRDQVYEGQHPAVVDRDAWDQTQALLATHAQRKARRSHSSDAFLAGKLYDDHGNRMSPSEAAKGAKRWRYYISQAIQQGRKQDAGSVVRVSAAQIEPGVLEAVRSATGSQDLPAETVRDALDKITIGRIGLDIRWSDPRAADRPTRVLTVPCSPTSSQRHRAILQGDGALQPELRPMRQEARRAFGTAYGRARASLERLVAEPSLTIAALATDRDRSERSIRQTRSLAFLDPALVEAAIEGRLPCAFGLKRLMALPPAWADQWVALGLQAPALH